MIADAQLGKFIHGAMQNAAETVSQRIRSDHYARGLEAIKPLTEPKASERLLELAAD